MNRRENQSNTKKNREIIMSVDKLFPSEENKSGTRGNKLDVDTIFVNTPLNNEPKITFTSNVLLERIKKRRKKKLNYYKQMLKYCHERIESSDNDQGTDVVFTIVENIPEFKDFSPRECLEYISIKLREEFFDTTILTDTTMFITWKYLELKKETLKQQEKERKEEEKEKGCEDFENKEAERQRANIP